MFSQVLARFRARERFKAVLDQYLHLLNRRVLAAEEVAAEFPDFCRPCSPAVEVRAPDAVAIDGNNVMETQTGSCAYPATYVYCFPKSAFPRLRVLASGGLLIDKKIIPNTGIGNQRASITASVQPSLLKSRVESCIVAPWPHYMPVTYGDFLLHVLARICRVVNHLTDEERARAVIAYPLANTAWEKDYLGKLGFGADRVVDTRRWKIKCSAAGVVFAPSGEGEGWAMRSAHPADYAEARKALLHHAAEGRAAAPRLYLQRKGRRRVLNEEELLAALKPYGFETIDLGGHSITDQMAMIAAAPAILGPHGANMISMLWSPRGAMVVELFNRGFRPAFNRQMAYNLSLDYHYLAQQPVERHDFAHLNWDLHVDVGVLSRFLAKVFG